MRCRGSYLSRSCAPSIGAGAASWPRPARSLMLISALLATGMVAVPQNALAGEAQGAARDQRAGAQKTFEAGTKLYDGRHFEEALAAFRASYQIVASPNSRLMVARSLRELGRNAEAYREYDAVAAEATNRGERYRSTADAANEEREEIKSKVALLTVRIKEPPPSLTVKVGQAVLEPSLVGSAVAFEPGPVVVAAEASDGSTARADVALTAGAASEVTLELVKKAEAPPPPPAVAAPPPAPPQPPVPPTSPVPLRTWAYVAGGVGVAGFVAFGVFGAMSSSKYSSLESACPGHVCPPGKQGDVDAGRTYQTVANVGLGVGIAGIAAGTALFFLGTGGGNGDAKIALDVGLGAARVRGRF
jgi:hypothetical protein